MCPRAHCRRRRNCNLLIRSTLLSATSYHNYGILSTTTGPDISGLLRSSELTRFAYFENFTEIGSGSFAVRFTQRGSTLLYGPHVEKRPSDLRDVDSSTREMTSGRRQKSREDLFCFCVIVTPTSSIERI